MTGSGTALDPYIIEDVDDLQAIEDDLDAYYELGGNIDASATSGWNDGAGFVPIGRGGTDFTGQLDGKEYTISGLFINMPDDSYIGLFGIIDGNAVLKNISMTGVDITGRNYTGALVGFVDSYTNVIDNCDSAGSVAGSAVGAAGDYIGGLIGFTQQDSDEGGTIDDCWSSCTISGRAGVGGLIGYDQYGAEVTSCYATGAVTASNLYGGGLVGCIYSGTYSQCYATGNVTAYRYGGGLFGKSSHSTIINCYARGNVDASSDYYAGGLIGYSAYDDIDNCYSTGTAVDSGADGLAGGLIGDKYAGAVDNCFWDTETSGLATSDGGTGKTTAQMKTEATFTDAGWDFTTIWTICSGVNNQYPCLAGVTPSCVFITAPTVTTDEETAINQMMATLNGTLDDDGEEACEGGFEWGPDTNYGVTTPTETKTKSESFSQVIGGLFPGTEYHFRALATNSAGTGRGADRSFTSTPLFSRGFALSRQEL